MCTVTSEVAVTVTIKMPAGTDFVEDTEDSQELFSPCQETYVSKKEMCLCLQSCKTLLSRRQPVKAADLNVSYENINSVTSLTKEQYVFKRVAGSKYKLGKLFVSKTYSPVENSLKVTITQYGNVQVTRGKSSKLSQEKLGLHVSLRRGTTLVSKQKIDISQNAALRVFKYNYVSCFHGVTESLLDSSSLRIKLKSKASMFRGAVTITQRDIELGETNNRGKDNDLDILLI